MDPEQSRTFLDVDNCRLREFVAQQSSPGVEIERKHYQNRKDSYREEQTAASAFDQEELRGVGAAVVGDLSAGGVPDGEELGGKGGGAGHAVVVAAELHEDKDEHAEESANRRYVEQVLNVAVPGAEIFGAATAVRRRRRRDIRSIGGGKRRRGGQAQSGQFHGGRGEILRN